MKRFTMLLFAVCFIISMAACEKMAVDDGKKSIQDETVASEDQPVSTIMTPGTVATIVVGGNPFSVEIAETAEDRARGLMNRESLAANSGMWFIFPEMGQEKFWMKDTLISLDLIFVDNNMKVVHIIENAQAESTDILSSAVPFEYVLEVSAGTAAEKNMKVGDSVQKRIGSE